MNTVRITIALQVGQQLRPAKLNDTIRTAGLAFAGFHDAATVILDCYPADEAAIRALIATHLATDWQAADDRAAHNAPILAQIAAIEAKQHRGVRELMLDPTNAGVKARLQSDDAAIAALRATLQ
jgi:hypothetical protein